MIKNYFKVAIRNLRSNKLLSFVNIAGLAIGLACVMLIMLFVKDEWSFDKFHKNGQDIYRLVQTSTDTVGNERRSGNSGMPHGPVFAAEVPEIEDYCRIKGWDMTTKKGKEGVMSTVLFADPSVFKIFTFDIVKGNETAMLKGRNSVVMTEKAAKKYFGNENPLGKTVEIEVDEGFDLFLVTGVVKAMPLNSSLQFDMLIPFDRQIPGNISAAEMNSQLNNWHNLYLNTFFLIRKDAAINKLEQKLWTVFLKHNGDEWEKSKTRRGTASLKYTLQPFFSIHLDKDFFASNGLSNWSDEKYSYILSGLAVLILIIACINFINIVLARSLQRSKEIGVRKVTGSSSLQVMLQFLSESFIVTALSFLAALLMVQLALPLFNDITGKYFSFAYIIHPVTVSIFIALVLVVSFLAGFYPAFIASRFQPIQTLYRRFKLSGKSLIGKSLVVLQFIIAIVLIISTIMFNKQFNYISHADLGYNAKEMIHLRFPWDKPLELSRFKYELEQNPAIQSVGTKSGNWNKTTFEINGKRTDWTYYEHIDDSYLQVMQIPLVKGRYLSYKNSSDTISNCLVNEAFVERYLDREKDPIGQVINSGNEAMFVAGVVKNYHSANLKRKLNRSILNWINPETCSIHI
jgi:putative ABC transport system permease protein